MAKEQVQTSQGLAELAQETEAEIEKLTEEIAREPKAIPGGSPRKARRRGLKKLLHKLRKDYVPRMKKYEEAKAIFAGRNSYSKTDHDATFMHMKEDHMRNGQLKPGYNIQVATTDQYVVDFALYPNPTAFKQYYIPYTMYEKEQTRKHKNDPSKLANWFYDEQDDYYLDQNDVRFSFKYYSRGKDKTTGQGRYNPNWQYLKEKVKAVLQSPEGSHIYRMRKYDMEPIFGHLKNVFGMRRTHLRGKKKIGTEDGQRTNFV